MPEYDSDMGNSLSRSPDLVNSKETVPHPSKTPPSAPAKSKFGTASTLTEGLIKLFASIKTTEFRAKSLASAIANFM